MTAVRLRVGLLLSGLALGTGGTSPIHAVEAEYIVWQGGVAAPTLAGNVGVRSQILVIHPQIIESADTFAAHWTATTTEADEFMQVGWIVFEPFCAANYQNEPMNFANLWVGGVQMEATYKSCGSAGASQTVKTYMINRALPGCCGLPGWQWVLSAGTSQVATYQTIGSLGGTPSAISELGGPAPGPSTNDQLGPVRYEIALEGRFSGWIQPQALVYYRLLLPCPPYGIQIHSATKAWVGNLIPCVDLEQR